MSCVLRQITKWGKFLKGPFSPLMQRTPRPFDKLAKLMGENEEAILRQRDKVN